MKLFTHYGNKRTYQVLEGSLIEGATWAGNSEDVGPLVVYKDVETGTLYYRPKKEFFGSVYDAAQRLHIPRFTEVKIGTPH